MPEGIVAIAAAVATDAAMTAIPFLAGLEGIAATIATALIMTTTSVGLGSAMGLYDGPDTDDDPMRGEDLMIRSPVKPRRIVYGEARVSGPIVAGFVTGELNEFLHLVIPLAEGPVEAIKDIKIGDRTLDEINRPKSVELKFHQPKIIGVTNLPFLGYQVRINGKVFEAPSVDHLVDVIESDPDYWEGSYRLAQKGNTVTLTAKSVDDDLEVVQPTALIDPSFGEVYEKGRRYPGAFMSVVEGKRWVRVNVHLGEDDQEADADLVAEISQYHSNRRLAGIGYLGVTVEHDPSRQAWPSGLEDVTGLVVGRKVLDPRKPAHDADDSSTFEYDCNAALVYLDYLRAWYGPGRGNAVHRRAINWDTFVAAAHTSDEDVERSEEITAWDATEGMGPEAVNWIRRLVKTRGEDGMDDAGIIAQRTMVAGEKCIWRVHVGLDEDAPDMPVDAPTIAFGLRPPGLEDWALNKLEFGLVRWEDPDQNITWKVMEKAVVVASIQADHQDELAIHYDGLGRVKYTKNGTMFHSSTRSTAAVEALFPLVGAITGHWRGRAIELHVSAVGKRYTVNGAIPLDATPSQVKKWLDRAICGGVITTDGGYTIQAGEFTWPTATITADQIISDVEYIPTPLISDRFNTARGLITDKNQGHTQTDYVPVVATDLRESDGVELPMEMDLQFVDDQLDAQRISRAYLLRSRAASLAFTGNLSLMPIRAGDTVNVDLPQLRINPADAWRVTDVQVGIRGIHLNLRFESPAMWAWSETDGVVPATKPVHAISSATILRPPVGLTVVPARGGEVAVTNGALEDDPDLYVVDGDARLMWSGVGMPDSYEIRHSLVAADVIQADPLRLYVYASDEDGVLQGQGEVWDLAAGQLMPVLIGDDLGRQVAHPYHQYQVRAVSALGGRSGWSDPIMVRAAAAALPEVVSGLELNIGGEGAGAATIWPGRDVKIQWIRSTVGSTPEAGDEPFGAGEAGVDPTALDYLVDVYGPDRQHLRTVATTDTWFTYSFEHNTEDHQAQTGEAGGYRALRFEVRARSRQNLVSPHPAILEVSNPIPVAPEGITITGEMRQVVINFPTPADADWAGVHVAMAPSPIHPDPVNHLVYSGPDTTINIPADGNTSYFVTLAFFDAFSATDATWSDPFVVFTPRTADQLDSGGVQVADYGVEVRYQTTFTQDNLFQGKNVFRGDVTFDSLSPTGVSPSLIFWRRSSLAASSKTIVYDGRGLTLGDYLHIESQNGEPRIGINMDEGETALGALDVNGTEMILRRPLNYSAVLTSWWGPVGLFAWSVDRDGQAGVFFRGPDGWNRLEMNPV